MKLWINIVLAFCLCASIFAQGRFAKVTSVIDGDTIIIDGKSYVRYLSIDCPEDKTSTWGRAAYDLNRRLVEGRKIYLEFDESRTDRYGRLLAYVFSGATLVNAELIRHGFARAVIIEPNIRYRDLILALEDEARQAKRGIWSGKTPPATVVVPSAPTSGKSKKETSSQTTPLPSGKYYVASKYSEVFHRPDCEWAKKIRPDNLIIFKTREEAIKSGRRPCKVCNP